MGVVASTSLGAMISSWMDIPTGAGNAHGIRLVACDMDGTLLDGDSQLPPGFWELAQQLEGKGITFIPASGRQLATLQSMFPDPSFDFIAENGNVVLSQGELVWQTAFEPELTADIIRRVRTAQTQGCELGLVLCGAHCAYIEPLDAHTEEFFREVELYYHSCQRVESFEDVPSGTPFVKYAIFDFGNPAQTVERFFADLPGTLTPVISGAHWIDIIDTNINKGTALRQLCQSRGISSHQVAVFGDYLNDLQLMGAGEWSFAMANAHPDLQAAAQFLAPTNTEYGVLQVLRRLFDIAED